MVSRESDQLIVLGGWESRSHGEAADSSTQPAGGFIDRTVGPDQSMPTSLRAIAQDSSSELSCGSECC